MPDDASRDCGAYLREARERAGIPLRTIAVNTKISMPALEALERNDLSRLPGGIFTRAFVRSYAKEVGIDPEDAVRRFVAQFPEAAPEEEVVVHVAEPEPHPLDEEPTSGRAWRVIGWSLPIVLVVVYFGFGGRLSWLRDQIPSGGPKTEVAAEEAPAGSGAPVLSTPVTAPPAPETATTQPPSAVAANAATQPQPGADPASHPAEVPAAATQIAASPGQEGSFKLSLLARGRCWVTVRSNGAIISSGTMEPGERRDLVVAGNVSLTLGNAAAMAVAVDGQPVRTLGGEGQVVTTLLNAQNLKTFLETR
jgi:cytoskeleton protein RodZ